MVSPVAGDVRGADGFPLQGDLGGVDNGGKTGKANEGCEKNNCWEPKEGGRKKCGYDLHDLGHVSFFPLIPPTSL